MNALAVDSPRGWVNPEFVIVLLGLACVRCLAVAAVQVVAALGSALLAAVVTALLAWLVKAAPVVAVPVPAVACLAGALVVSPWFLLGGLVCLAIRGGGQR